MKKVKVKAPATTANLGPGYDCLGIALELWNHAEFALSGDGILVKVLGEGQGQLPLNEENLVAKAAIRLYDQAGVPRPTGLNIICENKIPLGSGLGSSAAATLLGLLGANALLGNPLQNDELIALGTEIEGHPDNIAPALLGGLTISTIDGQGVLSQGIEIAEWQTAVLLPDVELSTKAARGVLPKEVSLKDAVANIGNTALVVEAFRSGDQELLARVMQDKLHQPYRMPLIPGAQEAIEAAQELGFPTALSGAGPSVIAFGRGSMEKYSAAMKAAFLGKGIQTRKFLLNVSRLGAKE